MRMRTFQEEEIDALVKAKMGGQSYNEIRAGLREEGMSEEDMRVLIRQVDARVLKEATQGKARQSSRTLYVTAWAIALAGLGLTLAYRRGMIPVELPALLLYSPFFLGIVLMFYAKRMQGKPRTEKKQEGTGAIRRQRPFK